MTRKKITIEQYIGNSWVELIDVPVEHGVTFGSIVETISSLTEQLHKGESFFMTLENGYSIIITAANGPVRLSLK